MTQFLGNILGEIGTRPRKTRYPGTLRKETPAVMRRLDPFLPNTKEIRAKAILRCHGEDPLPITQRAGADSQIKGDA